MNNALQSYATIRYLQNDGKDFIEIYALLSLKALQEKIDSGQRDIDPVELAKYFKVHYGLANVTVGAATKFLRRLETKHRIVRKDNHRFVINTDRLLTLRQNLPAFPDISTDLDRIMSEIIVSAKEKYSTMLDKDMVYQGLFDFFDRYAGEIIIEEKKAGDVGRMTYRKKTTSQKLRYIISEYIIDKEKTDPNTFNILLELAGGNMVASAIALQDFSEKDASLNKLTVYLDAPIIFNLLGLSGVVPKALAEELLTELRKKGCRLVIGGIHYREVNTAIEFAIQLIKEEHPDESHGNRIYFHAIREGLSDSDLTLIKESIESTIRRFGIEVLHKPTKEAGYPILREQAIAEKIKDNFRDKGKHSIPPHRLNSINRDAKVIMQVLMLRGDSHGKKLHDTGAIFVTNNIAICRAMSDESMDQDCTDAAGHGGIPPVILTENLSSILWVNSPTDKSAIEKKMLVDECMSSLRPRTDLLRLFYSDLKSKHLNHAIGDDVYLNAISSEVIQKMLAEMTFNDKTLYTDEIAVEIAKRMAERERVTKENKTTDYDNDVKKQIDRALKYGQNTTLALGLFSAFIATGLGFAGLYFTNSLILSIIIWIIAMAIFSWSFLDWLKWIPSRDKVSHFFARRFYKFFTQKDDFETQFNRLYPHDNC